MHRRCEGRKEIDYGGDHGGVMVTGIENENDRQDWHPGGLSVFEQQGEVRRGEVF